MLTIAVAVLTVKLVLVAALALVYRKRAQNWEQMFRLSSGAWKDTAKELTRKYEDRLAISIQHTADARADRDMAQMKLDAIARIPRRVPRRKFIATARRIARAVA